MKNLASWKTIHLSFASRVTLPKYVMEAILIYPMMINILPKLCIKEIQKMQRAFIWGDTNHKRKHHVVSEDKVTSSNCDEGLGFCDLDTMNRVCIMKLGGRIMNGDEDLWCKVLRGK